MLPLALTYPNIDPALVTIGPLAIRWYALAYIAGLLLGWRYILRLLRNTRLWEDAPGQKPPAQAADIDDVLLWATLGVVLGGRIGYILFYGLVYFTDYYLQNPFRIFAIWQGGMSFHGGLLGVALALFLFCRARKLDLLRMGDLVAAATPIGLFFGRLANFINGELYGRPSDVPWAMVFCNRVVREMHGGECPAGLLPRHPSQLYEASLEGLALFLLLRVLTHHSRALARPGLITGIFFAFYGSARAFCEFFRDPENPIAGTGLTMGMVLSLPMWLFAGYLIWHALKAENPKPQPR